MRLRAAFLILAAVGFWATPAAESHAQVFGLGGNLTGMPYNYFQSQEQLPFYAKFPPVYYSYPVARTYGYSPFAYPPGWMTPPAEPVAATPLDIENPYFVPEPSSLPATKKSAPASAGPESLTANGASRARQATAQAPRPKMIINPYVTQADSDGPGRIARLSSEP